MKPLQSQSKLTEIETRLNKESYLSRNNLPGSADAKMFLHLQSIKRYPDRKLYPNFYHWYVLMKQFSLSSIEKWIDNCDATEDDLLIHDLTQTKTSEKILPDAVSFKKIIIGSQALSEENVKLTKSQDYSSVLGHEIQYIMDVKIKDGIQRNTKEIIRTFLFLQSIQAPDIQEFMEQRRVRILAKMDPDKYEKVKNKISALEGVETFQSKKKDKRFKTVNSSSNFSGEL